MADDIIGTPVERVIPEGWSVVRNDVVKDGDCLEVGGAWSHAMGVVGTAVGAEGGLWGGRVIRRNEPEPSVEEPQGNDYQAWLRLFTDKNDRIAELKAKVAELEETIRWYKQLHDADKAKVADLEKALKDATNAHEINVRADAKRIAELEEKAATLCRDWERQTDAIRNLKEENTALRADRDHFKKWYLDFKRWHGELAAKIEAVKKAWEGA